MKKVFVTLFCLAITGAAVHAQQQTPPPAPPAHPQQAAPVPPPPPDPNAGKFKFEEETHDFGTVPEGPLAETDFEFKNVGKEPIIIKEAHGSCGCTVPTWPHDPILPKHKAVIHVTYNTQGRVGQINKDVTITSNASNSPTRLHITGTVKAKEAAPAPAPKK
jgi:hypothetical protein